MKDAWFRANNDESLQTLLIVGFRMEQSLSSNTEDSDLLKRTTWGTETSKYPEEKKTICDSVSSGSKVGASTKIYEVLGRVGSKNCKNVLKEQPC